MPRDGTATRQALMDAAEGLFLDHGFGGTSVDMILAEAGVTRGALFHHFDSKSGLATSVVQRWAEADLQNLDALMDRAERLTDDPLQQLLLFVSLNEEQMADVESVPDGCLLAVAVYQSGLFDETATAVVRANFDRWHERVRTKLDEVVATRPPRTEVDLDALADTITVLYEGGYVIDRSRDDRGAIPAQLRLFRQLLESLFAE